MEKRPYQHALPFGTSHGAGCFGSDRKVTVWDTTSYFELELLSFVRTMEELFEVLVKRTRCLLPKSQMARFLSEIVGLPGIPRCLHTEIVTTKFRKIALSASLVYVCVTSYFVIFNNTQCFVQNNHSIYRVIFQVLPQ